LSQTGLSEQLRADLRRHFCSNSIGVYIVYKST